MKVAFFGTPHFAAEVLRYLIDRGVDVVAVVSQPDRPKGRSQRVSPTPVKQVILERGLSIPIFQPEKPADPLFAAQLADCGAELFAVVAYGAILRQHLLDLPAKGCINLHTSLLPKYRGAAPIQRAVMAGENATGVSIIEMVRLMDAGDILAQERVPILPEETFGAVEAKLLRIGAPLFHQTIATLEKGEVSRTTQDASQVTFAPKIELEECQIDWSQPPHTLHNLIRGVNPYPGAWVWVEVRGEKKRLKVWRARTVEGEEIPKGELRGEKERWVVGCGNGGLQLLEIQLEGKRRMDAGSLFRGLPEGEISFF